MRGRPLRSAVSRFDCECGAAECVSAGAGEDKEKSTDAKGRLRETMKHIVGYGAGRGALTVFWKPLPAEPLETILLAIQRDKRRIAVKERLACSSSSVLSQVVNDHLRCFIKC